MLAVAIFLFFFSSIASANKLSVTHAKLVNQDSGANTVAIKFDVSWENSWRDVTNYDAVWVFTKYCTSNCSTSGTWAHATMKTAGTNPSGVSQGSGTGLDVIVSADKKGAFLQRSANGTGTATTTNVELVWDYNADGVSGANAAGINTRIRVYGVEMVYIPTGSFYAGDGNEAGGLTGSTAAFKQGSSCRDPWYIQGEGAMSVSANVPCNNSNYYYVSAVNTGEDASGSVFTIGANFPKGYQPFYMMKYELSQGQYRDFLNTLTRSQQGNRVYSTISADSFPSTYVMAGAGYPICRVVIRAPLSGNGTTNPIKFGCDMNMNGVFNEEGDGEWVAPAMLIWPDLTAYLDWAGLRPMTELEYEKSARGAGVSPVNLEYVWGSAAGYVSCAVLSGGGYSGEGCLTTGGNIVSENNLTGCARSGMFATTTSTRVQSGASYYGVMELSGNSAEAVVTVGNATGRSFIGTHGDGLLSAAGYGTNSDWPGFASGEVSGGVGAGFRGGSWTQAQAYTKTSNRAYGTYQYLVARTWNYGIGRGVRTASA